MASLDQYFQWQFILQGLTEFQSILSLPRLLKKFHHSVDIINFVKMVCYSYALSQLLADLLSL